MWRRSSARPCSELSSGQSQADAEIERALAALNNPPPAEGVDGVVGDRAEGTFGWRCLWSCGRLAVTETEVVVTPRLHCAHSAVPATGGCPLVRSRAQQVEDVSGGMIDGLSNGVVHDQVDGGANQVLLFLHPTSIIPVVGGGRLALAEQIDPQRFLRVAPLQAAHLCLEGGDLPAVGSPAGPFVGEGAVGLGEPRGGLVVGGLG